MGIFSYVETFNSIVGDRCCSTSENELSVDDPTDDDNPWL